MIRKALAKIALERMISRYNKLTVEMDEIGEVLGYRTEEDGYAPLDRAFDGQATEDELEAIREKEYSADPETLMRALKVCVDRLILHEQIAAYAEKWGLTVYVEK